MSNSELFIGMGGWDLPPFHKYFYPPSKPKGFRKLEFYSRYFDHVEVNTTFYNTRFPADQVDRWLEDVSANEQFMFTAKLFRGYTHNFDATKSDYMAIRQMMDRFQDSGRFGGLVIQFPSSFSNKNETREYLAKLAQGFSQYPLFLDVRHRTWGEMDLEGFCGDHGMVPINIDLPQLKQHRSFTTVAGSETAYFRMMGRNMQAWKRPWKAEANGATLTSDRYNYFYGADELHDLVQRIRSLEGTVRRAFVVFHNDPEANSLINGFQIKKLLHQENKQMLPKNLIKLFPNHVQPVEPDYTELPLFRKCV